MPPKKKQPTDEASSVPKRTRVTKKKTVLDDDIEEKTPSSTIVENDPLSLKPILNKDNNALKEIKKDIPKLKKTRDVLFEKLFEAANYLDDEFWKNYFVDLSKGKLNKKIHVDLTSVSYSCKRNSFLYVYENKDPKDIANELRPLIRDTLFVYSEIDMEHEENEMEVIANEFIDSKTEDNWKKIKNKKMRDNLITKFVLHMKNKHKLSWQQARKTYDMINNALYVFHTHCSDDISMKDGCIDEIDELIICKDDISNPRLLEHKIPEKQTFKKTNLEKDWTKCVTNMAKSCLTMLCSDTDTTKMQNKKRTRKTKASLKDDDIESKVDDEDFGDDIIEDTCQDSFNNEHCEENEDNNDKPVELEDIYNEDNEFQFVEEEEDDNEK